MRIKILAGLCLSFVSGMAFGSDIYVYNEAGTDPIKLIKDVKKLTFTETSMTVTTSETEETVNFVDFSHFTFQPEKEGAVTELQSDGEVKVFAVGNTLVVKSTQTVTDVAVWSMQGSKLIEMQPMQNEADCFIDIPAGIYLVKVVAGNKESVHKIIKR